MRSQYRNVLEEPILCFLSFGVSLHYSINYHYRDFTELTEADPEAVFSEKREARDPLPGMYKAMKSFIEPPRSSPIKASSSSQASNLDNVAEGQGDSGSQQSVIQDPANVD